MKKNMYAKNESAYGTKTKKASAIVFALIVLSVILITAISVAAVTMTERRSSMATDKSVQSFQIADSGAEIMLNQIYKGENDNLNSLAVSLGKTCSGGSIGSSISSEKTYTVNFYKSDGKLMGCGDPISDITNIKSIGSYASTTRAISVAVAASQGARVWVNDGDAVSTGEKYEVDNPFGTTHIDVEVFWTDVKNENYLRKAIWQQDYFSASGVMTLGPLVKIKADKIEVYTGNTATYWHYNGEGSSTGGYYELLIKKD
jgi:hypothetical protein